MLSTLVIAFFGLAFTFFAVQNTMPVTIQLGEFMMADVPLYLVVAGSLLTGLLIAWTFQIARAVSAFLSTVHGKDREGIRTRKTMADLEQKIHELETANSRLRSEHAPEPKLSMVASSTRK